MGKHGVGALLILAVCVAPSTASAGVFQEPPPSVLDVPFLPQSEQLCGGAAAAMVLRYWGERDVFSEDFAPLLDKSSGGIQGEVLAHDVRQRGWRAHAFRGDGRAAKQHLDNGRPLIALIEDRPGRFHYVVLVGWLEKQVVLHDPARAPFRVITGSAFTMAWAASNFWTLLILPDSNSDAPPIEEDSLAANSDTSPVPVRPVDNCDSLVSQGVVLARSGDQQSAEVVLTTAFARCPASALAARELAGLRFVQSRWHEAGELAALATVHAPDDAHAWRLLAASRFLQNDVDGALSAWNRIGEPRIDLVRVEGLERTRHKVIEDLLELDPRTELTAAGLQRARRRLAMLPAASATRVGYRPVPGGRAEIEAAIVERPQLPGAVGLVAVGVHALLERELLLGVAVPAGSGARWILGWRWWENRPRLGTSLLVPSAFGRSGLWHLDGFWERQSYDTGSLPTDTIVREDRARVALSYTDWVTVDTRLTMGVALDRWDGTGGYAPLSGSLENRLAEDRIAVRVQGAFWPPLGHGVSFGTGTVDLSWRSGSSARPPHSSRLTARLGLATASARAPFALWPGADVGHARDILARAHPLLRGGVVSGGIFGRTLAHGGTELQAATFARGPARIGVALFADVARAWQTLESPDPDRTHIDVGMGLRLRLAGEARTIRIDVAHGLSDGRTAVSAGWQLPWPD